MKTSAHLYFFTLVALGVLSAQTTQLSSAAVLAEQENVELLAHADLNGKADGGEGLALQQMPDGTRLLFIAHEGQQNCLSIVDVTKPDQPLLVNQLPSPGPGVTRCNSLSLADNVLAVADQTEKVGMSPGGMWLLDVADIAKIRAAHRLQDLALSFFDTSGPASRGVHWLYFADGEFVHLATGTRDSRPTNPNDDQFYVIVDVRDRHRPREVGRWWMPGTQQGDSCLPKCLPQRAQPVDHGYRAHGIEVFPERPDRAYVGYIDGGQLIFDISGLADVRSGKTASFSPRLISRVSFQPPYPGFTHTVQPVFSRNLALDIEETNLELCKDAPKFVWLVDIRAETNPVVVGTAPLPQNTAELCKRGGRSGTHNLEAEYPTPTSARLQNTFVTASFNAGIRIYRFIDAPIPGAPPHIEEIGFYIPAPPLNNRTHTIQMNHVLVDEKKLIYAVDRVSGGLYILQYTGPGKLD
jgi:hypothetical protein